MDDKRCKFADPAHAGTHCGSYAFNLARDGIKQGQLCDVHYWQSRCEKAEAAALSQPAAAQGGFVSVPVEPDLPMVIAGETYIGRHAWKKMIEASPNFRRATAGNRLTSINFINDVLVNGELIKAGTEWPLEATKATP